MRGIPIGHFVAGNVNLPISTGGLTKNTVWTRKIKRNYGKGLNTEA